MGTHLPPRKIEEARGVWKPHSLSAWQPWGGHVAIDGERLKYGVSLPAWREPALLLLLPIDFYVNRSGV